MNKSILIGRITKDLELKSTTNGKEVCQFTIAVNRPFTNENGVREADFINCVVYGKQAENLCKYQKKGSQIAVEGRIQVRNYDNNEGKKVYVTEIIVENITFLSSANNAQVADKNAEVAEKKQDPFQAFGDSIEVNENDLPF